MSPQDQAPRLLVVGRDSAFPDEMQRLAGSEALPNLVVHTASSFAAGVDEVRYRGPQLLFVDVSGDLGTLRTFARDVRSVAPHVTLVGAYRQEDLERNGSGGSLLIEALRAGVADFVRRPLSTTEVRQVFQRWTSGAVGPAEPERSGSVVSFVSNKGGVGKSTLAVNTAVALARRHPGRVLLVDAALQLGVCASMLDLEPATSIVDVARERQRIDGTLLRQLTVAHSSGLRLLAAPSGPVEAADLHPDTLTRVLGLARRTFDYVVVDTFPILDDALVAVLDMSDVGYVVLQGTVPVVLGTGRFLQALEQIGFAAARQRVVLNHNYARFPGDLTAADVSSRLEGRTLDHVVPYDRRHLIALNAGRPLVLSAQSWFGFGRSIRALVDGVESGASRSVAPPDGPSELPEASP